MINLYSTFPEPTLDSLDIDLFDLVWKSMVVDLHQSWWGSLVVPAHGMRSGAIIVEDFSC